MNIVLTNDQFDQVKNEVASSLINILEDEMKSYVKKIHIPKREEGQIKAVVKSELSEVLKNKILNTFNINGIEEEIRKATQYRIDNALSNIINCDINVNITAKLNEK